jgi:cell division protein ZapA (FtsZ GTPase activity inhibitor)
LIEISIGKSQYKISCKEEEEEKLFELSKSLNERVNRLSLSMKNADEKTLLVIAALMMENELRDAESNEEVDESSKFNDQDMYDTISENMENVADYIEKLTKKIENY